MAVDVVLANITPDQMLDIVRDLKKQGLVLERDFNFRYQPAQYDNDGWSQITSKRCIFTFTDEKFSTLFILKYGR
jgi:hypothetical protein